MNKNEIERLSVRKTILISYNDSKNLSKISSETGISESSLVRNGMRKEIKEQNTLLEIKNIIKVK